MRTLTHRDETVALPQIDPAHRGDSKGPQRQEQIAEPGRTARACQPGASTAALMAEINGLVGGARETRARPRAPPGESTRSTRPRNAESWRRHRGTRVFTCAGGFDGKPVEEPVERIDGLSPSAAQRSCWFVGSRFSTPTAVEAAVGP